MTKTACRLLVHCWALERRKTRVRIVVQRRRKIENKGTHEAGKLSVSAAAGLASRKIDTSRATSHGAQSVSELWKFAASMHVVIFYNTVMGSRAAAPVRSYLKHSTHGNKKPTSEISGNWLSLFSFQISQNFKTNWHPYFARDWWHQLTNPCPRRPHHRQGRRRRACSQKCLELPFWRRCRERSCP